MKTYVLTAIAASALPFMALGQTTDEQQTTSQGQMNQGQTKQTQATVPAKGKNMRNGQSTQSGPESATSARGQTNVKNRAHVNGTQAGAHSSTSQTATINKDEFRTRHSEMFSLGRHPKEFYVQRYGASHFRLIGNSYFVFLDGCWVAVDVDGFTYSQRVICPGDSDFVEVAD